MQKSSDFSSSSEEKKKEGRGIAPVTGGGWDGTGWTEPSRRVGSRSRKRRCSTSYNTTTNPSANANKLVRRCVRFLHIPLISINYYYATSPLPIFHTLAERDKKDALRSAVRVSDLLVDTVDGGVQELFVNEKRIEHEARALLTTIARYRKQTDQWLAATNEINSVLKVPCYSRALELPISQVYY